MGGDGLSSGGSESSLDQEFAQHLHELSKFLNEDALSRRISLKSAVFEAHQKRKLRVYADVLRSYYDVQHRSEYLDEAKRKIISYSPGLWIDKISGTKLSDYNIPKMTTLLLIGPKGSGKSSLINKVSKVFEKDKHFSERAQVSDIVDGTYFTQEYVVPRNSGAFCLYDTRGFSNNSSENKEVLKYMMTKGVQHGELVPSDFDHVAMERERTRNHCYFPKPRMVNFVIFVVNGLSVLEAIDSDNEMKKLYTQMIKTTFNNPFLLFKDDRPIIVVTHGDLLSIIDRVRVRVHLGELLGFYPHKQIFDIPVSDDDRASELAIIDMIRYCLEHADRNIPMKGGFDVKISSQLLFMMMVVLIIVYVCLSLKILMGCNQCC